MRYMYITSSHEPKISPPSQDGGYEQEGKEALSCRYILHVEGLQNPATDQHRAADRPAGRAIDRGRRRSLSGVPAVLIPTCTVQLYRRPAHATQRTVSVSARGGLRSVSQYSTPTCVISCTLAVSSTVVRCRNSSWNGACAWHAW